ncbi:hypothetical protein FRB99_007409 [Tulasnella sp. 403]|nr:hypothetical protein FRB99_007409 [Tulasnella sp. 403]
MAKKKFARPYATTAVRQVPNSSKKAPESEDSDTKSSSERNASSAQSRGPSSAHGTKGTSQASSQIDQLDEENLRLQELVTKLQDKTEKEINRTIKAIEFDRRQAKTYYRLDISRALREKVLELAKSEDADNDRARSRSFEDPEEKLLPRLGVTYGVLRRLGFSETRVEECLNSISGIDLEEALTWLYLYCEEAELLDGRGESRDVGDPPPVVRTPYTPLSTSSPAPLAGSSATPATSSISSPLPRTSSTGSILTAVSKNQDELGAVKQRILSEYGTSNAAASQVQSDTDSDSDDPNVQWARVKLRMVAHSQNRTGDPTVLATLKQRLEELSNDYYFRKPEAEAYFREEQRRRDDARLLERLRDLSTEEAQGPKETRSPTSLIVAAAPADGPPVTSPKAEQAVSDDESDTMFGNMLDEVPSEITTSSGVTITVRDMGLLRHWAGRTPKLLLQETVAKIDRPASISYSLSSGSSRAARASVIIRFSGGRTQEWTMTDVACPDKNQAEQYVSTVALHRLTFVPQAGFATGGTGTSQTYHRLLPPAFLDLWHELEAKRKESEHEINRKAWAKLEGILKTKLAVQENVPSRIQKVTQSTKDAVTGVAKQRASSGLSQQLMLDFHNRQASIEYQEMLVHRNALPIAGYRSQIIEALQHSQVVVLSGETGCGKSTQLPSFILEDQLSQGIPCKILCTEPRRISAITLAQRVSRELGEPPGVVGTPASLIGYSIRLESNTSRNTRLTFCTNGIALRMLEGGSGDGGKGTAIDDITHVVIDEVHERSIESDFLLIVLKSLLEQRPDLKVVLMSATLDAGKISAYFGNCPTLHVPGRTFPVDVKFLEDAVEYTQWKLSDNSPYAHWDPKGKGQKNWSDWNEDALLAAQDGEDTGGETTNPTKLEKRYSSTTITTMNLLDQRLIPYDLILRLLERLCFEDMENIAFSAAILVFMPGINEIRRLHDTLAEHALFGSDGFRLYPLHSTISSENQSAAFDIPPPGVRKIVIATNIAETGITIPDVTCVIDTGKHRETRFDEKRQISRLEEAFIARSNAAQRRGRAGRVQKGLCYHLFTKYRHDNIMLEHPLPEMTRLSLSDLALRIKILNVNMGNSIEEVLSRALDPPSSINIQRAVSALVEVKALTPAEDITPMGRLLSKMPTDVHLGKFLLAAVVMKCLDPALTIAATLSAKSPFITPLGQEDEADRAKSKFQVENSDFLTIHSVFSAWRNVINQGESVRKFCRENYLSYQNLQQIEDIRQQLLSYLADSGFLKVDEKFKRELTRARYTRRKTYIVSVPPEVDVNSSDTVMINTALVTGLYPRIISIGSDGQMLTLSNNQSVSFHPSSVNFRFRGRASSLGVRHLCYFTMMQSKKLFVWESGPVKDIMLLLLCGDADFKLVAESGVIDRKIKYRFAPKTVVALKYLRTHLISTMSQQMRAKPVVNMQDDWFDIAVELLKTEV